MSKTDYLEIIKKEGDLKIWKHKGILCMIRRHPGFLHLCGYVACERGHPLFKKTYTDLSSCVHGGLTFSGSWGGKDLWWFGFDCAHCGDAVFYKGKVEIAGEVYRDMNYVTKETERLAEWLKRQGVKKNG